MNFNDIFTVCILWATVCLLSVVLMSKVKAPLGRYYKTLHIALVACGLLPLAIIGIFFFLVLFK